MLFVKRITKSAFFLMTCSQVQVFSSNQMMENITFQFKMLFIRISIAAARRIETL